ncbi:hypothetical protein D3C72_1669710 [compost metagenome]
MISHCDAGVVVATVVAVLAIATDIEAVARVAAAVTVADIEAHRPTLTRAIRAHDRAKISAASDSHFIFNLLLNFSFRVTWVWTWIVLRAAATKFISMGNKRHRQRDKGCEKGSAFHF